MENSDLSHSPFPIPNSPKLPRTLIAGIGYRNLRDFSLGVLVTDALQMKTLPSHVSVEDLSYNPIAVVQRLEDDPPEQRFARVIVVSAASRVMLRPPGTVTAYHWNGALPSADEIQRAITEAVTGVIHVDNTLIVAQHFGALPDDVIVVEVEPVEHDFGEELSPVVAVVVPRILELLTRLANDPSSADGLPRTPLGGVSLTLQSSGN